MKNHRSMFAGLALASLFASVSLVHAAPSNHEFKPIGTRTENIVKGTRWSTAAVLAAAQEKTALPTTIQRILNAEAKPGEQARSHGDPHISYRVLENGMVEKIDDRYGTQKFFKPKISRINPYINR
ncbi:hypothetical protein LJR231_000633 [Phyllobacterium sp. LjRoot231]|uniref:hypothetical protein n=1 Tax=Phyllobacterium sp. LjRoot231 TaxID=3342289 RepID=UPI003ECC5C17